jgi:ankyrin repeat protein
VADTPDVKDLIIAIGNLNHAAALKLLEMTPSLATADLDRNDEFFLAERYAQVYQGDTALHAAAFSYDVEMATQLIARGAHVRARNRRGGEPLHSAVMGNPASDTWDPGRQRDIILFLVTAGADPNARATGGVTPLHRAVRNRCSAAVEALLGVEADPDLESDSGSMAHDWAQLTTGRGGTGSAEAKAEQIAILDLLGRTSI